MNNAETVFSISQLNRLARQTLEREFPLCWVAGEVSNLTRAMSGHVYFTLKDDAAQVRCIVFRMRAQSIPWRLENGQQVEARVLVSLYEPRGDFQLTVETMRRAGLGRLFEEFSRLKEKLRLAGLFAPEKKRPLPRFPRRIGIVSSPRAAALHDVLITLRRRAPHLSVILYPTQVQGGSAANDIAEAIARAGQRNECDLLLLVRGGGGIEDLWAFNEEAVARAIASSRLPIISGIGHETDTTIADFVADIRAATPTAAAELATQEWSAIAAQLTGFFRALNGAVNRRIAQEQQRLDRHASRLIDPISRMQREKARLDMLNVRLRVALTNNLRGRRSRLDALNFRLNHGVPRMEARRNHLSLLAQRLRTALLRQQQRRHHLLDIVTAALAHLNPRNIQARGFAIVRAAEGTTIGSARHLHVGERIILEFHDGQATAGVLDIQPVASPTTPAQDR
jgi:exodeoxyribonuclease VII large subunit